MAGVVTLRASELLRSVQIRVTGLRTVGLRFAAAAWLIRLAGVVAGVGLVVEDGE